MMIRHRLALAAFFTLVMTFMIAVPKIAGASPTDSSFTRQHVAAPPTTSSLVITMPTIASDITFSVNKNNTMQDTYVDRTDTPMQAGTRHTPTAIDNDGTRTRLYSNTTRLANGAHQRHGLKTPNASTRRSVFRSS